MLFVTKSIFSIPLSFNPFTLKKFRWPHEFTSTELIIQIASFHRRTQVLSFRISCGFI